MKIRLILLFSLVLFNFMANAAVIGKEVEYRQGDTLLKGYLAYDDATTTKRPGVLVVHEWWGHNDYARRRARMLAELGYTALAVDMYGDGKLAEHPKDAGKFSSAVGGNMPLAKARFLAALDFLHKQASVDSQRTAAIGYCFGGGIVLNMARLGVDMDGVVSFHGSLKTQNPAQKGMVKAEVLVLNGAADPFVKAEDIVNFEKEMQAADVEYQLINYPGAKHAFTSPEADANGKKFNLPLAYNPVADRKSWQSMQEFFRKIF